MKHFYYIIVFISIALQSCEKSLEPESTTVKKAAKISLSVTKCSCTEAWLDFQLPQGGREFTFWVDSLSLTLAPVADTTVFLENLLPSKNYTITVRGQETEKYLADSLEYQFQTLDTTTNSFNYEFYEFGDGISNSFYDVAIINEQNIWVVGGIYLADSSGQVSKDAYNALHWDGNSWNPKRILFHGDCSTVKYPILYSIQAFSDDQILLTNGGAVGVFDGDSVMLDCEINGLITGRINKIYGSSLNDFYTLGNHGELFFWNGDTWKKENTKTEYPLKRMFKSDDDLFVIGSETFNGRAVVLNKSTEKNEFIKLIESDIIGENLLFEMLFGSLSGVWADENGVLYIGGVYLYQYANSTWSFEKKLKGNFFNSNPYQFTGYIYDISGIKSNDITIIGAYNTLKHFNGLRWQQIGLPYNEGSPLNWLSVQQEGNTIVAVGYEDRKAIVIKLTK